MRATVVEAKSTGLDQALSRALVEKGKGDEKEKRRRRGHACKTKPGEGRISCRPPQSTCVAGIDIGIGIGSGAVLPKSVEASRSGTGLLGPSVIHRLGPKPKDLDQRPPATDSSLTAKRLPP
ncbi:hypothetical protein E4U42_003459 [Claviceps africana]|uniref:Uncharacterized protein n=1 Tax=Claviceps africana TaxID=83212 RepID=A0A8K0J6U4_9HYPO|nr:hypothetical protein E4U42_003459 [Claviceps africana]